MNRSLMLEDFCRVDGCGRVVKFGHVACRKHVHERRREIRRVARRHGDQ